MRLSSMQQILIEKLYDQKCKKTSRENLTKIAMNVLPKKAVNIRSDTQYHLSRKKVRGQQLPRWTTVITLNYSYFFFSKSSYKVLRNPRK